MTLSSTQPPRPDPSSIHFGHGGRVCIVTGGAQGIGEACVRRFAAEGAKPVIVDVDDARGQALAVQLGALYVHCDVGDKAQVDALVTQVLAAHGRIDVLVNNAGFAVGGFAEDIRLDELRKQFDTNFFGAVAMTKAVLPVMRRQKSGHIIMVSSVSGRAGAPVISSYSASKFALEGWSESLRLEARALGIHVVLVEPGSFETDIWTRNVMVGADCTTEASQNRERARRFSERVKGKKKADPRPVAQLIARIAQDPKPKLRYVAGGDARMQLLTRALLPWRLYERLVAWATKIDD
jgi:NAD(P)-dependent dehydrogenase (short-subunit alcohol dehydrogenase family)